MRVRRVGGVRRRLINYGVLLAAISTSLLVYVSLIAAALLNMRSECETSNRSDIWGVFEGRLLAAVLEDSPETGYEELIQRFGFKSPSHAFNALNTAKRMFKRHLRSVIAEYAHGDREVEDELRELKERLLRAG